MVWDGQRMIEGAIEPNEALRNRLEKKEISHDSCVIEMVACYGMAVGKEVFETCVWIGRFLERVDAKLVYRRDVKLHVCGSARAKDANIAQALRDKYGEVGTKKNPGPLFGIKSHLWAALALADYAQSLTPHRP